MKALKITRKIPLGELQVSDVPDPQPGPGEVLVRLKAAALNRRDLGMFNWEPDCHFVLGSDGAGVVEALGRGVRGWAPGDPVIIYPALDWGDREDAFGSSFSILGWPRDGTFAESIAVPSANVFPKPAHLSFEQAAALPLAGLTAFRAVVVRAGVRPAERVLIHGIGGGVAQFALRFCKIAGAQVMVTSTSASKAQAALALGADLAVDLHQMDWQEAARQWTAGRGLDLVVDSVGGELFAASLPALRRGGRLVTYGTTHQEQATIDLGTLFWHQVTLAGSTMGSPHDFAWMLDTVNAHGIVPVIDSVWPLAEGRLALQHLANGLQFGKIVLSCA